MSDYEVGYKKPPKHSQWPKGTSGNKSGRPKREKDPLEVLTKAASQRVTVTENGKSRRISKLKVAATQIVNKAAGGDLRASKMLLDYLVAASGLAPDEVAPAELQEALDEALLKDLSRRLRGSNDGGSNG
ncbi:DUF5681 domain-containing protein [Brevundimonas aveniformis]|uniref:DUF5681 domain-containing protein n=1 Tax=Brevundimonas aveniformis TaxID=370977 RepID=UPI0006882B29|nr:DUF5681 domain-containing protein [Brevundimonas aveniformis]